jgi:hypothetical protein
MKKEISNSKKMHVLFCTTGTSALGESFTVANFANELIGNGHRCFFIAPSLGKKYLLSFGFNEDCFLDLPSVDNENGNNSLEENKKRFEKFLKEVKPDFVIVADWHHFKDDGLSINDTYSLYWIDKNIPMGTFDHVGFAPEGKECFQELRKFSSQVILNFHMKKFPPLPERISFIIRPCPHHNNLINNNLINNKNNIYNWPIFKNKYEKNGHPEKFRKTYNLKDEVIILNPIGMWQERAIEKMFQIFHIKGNYYLDIFLPIIFNVLDKINKNFVYVVITANIKKEEIIKYKNITLIKRPPLRHELFMENLVASNIFITDNLISSNMGKAVFSNILPIAFKNTTYLDKKLSFVSSFPVNKFISEKISMLTDCSLVFPFRSFPAGLEELEDMYKDNPFTNCFIEQELFNEESNIQLFEKLCNSDDYKNHIITAQNNYIENNAKLLSAEEILAKV